MIVFGGRDNAGAAFNDVWILTNANGIGGTPTWFPPIMLGTAPANCRSQHSAVLDAVTNTMLVFGGTISGNGCGNNTTSETWILTNANAVGSNPTWTELFPTISPGARTRHTAIYDRASDQIIIFGGFTFGCAACYSDVWVLGDCADCWPWAISRSQYRRYSQHSNAQWRHGWCSSRG